METAKALPIPKERLLNTCFLLFCLCMIDAIFTDFGIRYGHIQEANPFVRSLYDMNVIAFYMMKAGLPILLFILMQYMKPSQLVRNFNRCCINYLHACYPCPYFMDHRRHRIHLVVGLAALNILATINPVMSAMTLITNGVPLSGIPG